MARAASVRRFAQAAFEVALAREGLDAWEKDFAAVHALLANVDVAGFLDAPQVPLDAKTAGVKTLLGNVSPRVRNFVCVLVARRQSRNFSAIAREFQRLADENRGIVRADVVTAVPLDDERRRRVSSALGELMNKKRVVMTERVDPAVLGGVVARAGDRLIDGSTRTRLHGLRSALTQRPA